MTKEERLKEIMSCDCRDVYKEREMSDPNCCYCNHKDNILKAMESYAQSLTKELQDKVKQLEGLIETLVKDADLWDSREKGIGDKLADAYANDAWQQFKKDNGLEG